MPCIGILYAMGEDRLKQHYSLHELTPLATISEKEDERNYLIKNFISRIKPSRWGVKMQQI